MNRSFENRGFGHQRRPYNHNYNQQGGPVNQCSPHDNSFIPLDSNSPSTFQRRKYNNYQYNWRSSGGPEDFVNRGRHANNHQSLYSPYRTNKPNYGNRMHGSSPNNSHQWNYSNNPTKEYKLSDYIMSESWYEDPWIAAANYLHKKEKKVDMGPDMSSDNEVISSQETNRNSVKVDSSSSVVSEEVSFQES